MAMKIEDLLKQINDLQNDPSYQNQTLQESQVGNQGSPGRSSSFGLSDSASQF